MRRKLKGWVIINMEYAGPYVVCNPEITSNGMYGNYYYPSFLNAFPECDISNHGLFPWDTMISMERV